MLKTNKQIKNNILTLHKINYSPLDKWYNKLIKRTQELLFSVLLTIIFIPLYIIISILILIKDSSPILFKQVRIGKKNKPFVIHKFKSMKENDTENAEWSNENDKRITKIGKLLRKTSIDELPQISIDVILGKMSLIGPRPEIPFYVDKFSKTIPFYNEKHRILPGITGLAQINGYKGNTSIEERIKYDIYYIENWSFIMDWQIAITTIIQIILEIKKVIVNYLKTKY